MIPEVFHFLLVGGQVVAVALHSDHEAQDVVQLQVLREGDVAQLFVHIQDVEGQLVDLVGDDVQNDFVVHGLHSALHVQHEGLAVVYFVGVLQNELIVLVVKVFDQGLSGLGAVGVEGDLIHDGLVDGVLTVGFLDEAGAVGFYE